MKKRLITILLVLLAPIPIILLGLYGYAWMAFGLNPIALTRDIVMLPLLELPNDLLQLASRPKPSPTPTPALTRVGRWQQDLEYLYKNLPKLHVQPWANTNQRTFQARTEALSKLIPTASDTVLLAEFSSIVASLGDGHSELYSLGSTMPRHRLPVQLKWFNQQLWIVATTPKHANLFGLEVLSFDGVSASEAARRILPFAPAENTTAQLKATATSLGILELLRGAGIRGNTTSIQLELRNTQGQKSTAQLEGLTTAISYSKMLEKPALYQQNPEQDFWYKYLEPQQITYLKLNSFSNLLGFWQLLETIRNESRVSKKLIVDLRGNGGGSGLLIPALLEIIRFKGTPAYVLTDRDSFSAAVSATAALIKMGAKHIGEAPGQKPNYWGTAQIFTLPNSKFEIQYATTFEQNVEGNPNQLEPEKIVIPTAKQYFNSQDPVLETVLAEK